MAIRSWVPGFPMPNKETRMGDVEVLTDGTYTLVIDGGCGEEADALVSYLKRNDVTELYLILTHPHYDHYNGLNKILNDNYFKVITFYCYDPKTLENGLSDNKGSDAVREDISALKNIIKKCKNKGVTVKYLANKNKVTLGEIKFTVYRKQPTYVADDDDNGWSYVNDGSLCLYFPELYYWTSGDGSERIWDLIKSLGIKVKYFKIPHHGNNCTRLQAEGLKNQGANYCWYNSLEPDGIGTTDFTAYGARRCLQAGMKVFTIEGDINWIAKKGYLTIYKGGKKYTFSVPYSGVNIYRQPNSTIVRDVFEGEYSKGDYRTTRLLDAFYYPVAVQNKVNLVVNVAKNIISGKANYGKNEARIARLDKKYGAGYGQLIQDEINSLLKAKSAKW